MLFGETSIDIEVTTFFRASKNSCCLFSQVQVLDDLVMLKREWAIAEKFQIKQ